MKKPILAISILVLLMLSLSRVVFSEEDSRITDKIIPLQIDQIPKRPSPILELGDPFLKPGTISEGYQLPTGAVWQPSLIVWGTLRTAIQANKPRDSKEEISEIASRFDLFANLFLTQTEKLLLGIRPLDKNGKFTSYKLDSQEDSSQEAFQNELNFNIRTLFFEGDFGEIFPILDKKDSLGLDFAFAVGRQELNFQDGILINDNLDSLGISKINLKPSWAVNHRMTVLWAWDEINRTSLAEKDPDSSLYAFLNEIDFRANTLEFDIVYVESKKFGDDGVYWGIGSTQRFGKLNSTFRVLGSIEIGTQSEHNQNGELLFTELSRTVNDTDFIYLNNFWAIDNFRSATRAPATGGPLAPVGISFASVELGRYVSALNGNADDAFGSALGYQTFFADGRRQLLFELAGRYAHEDLGQRAVAFSVNFQTALGRRSVIKIDTYCRYGAERTELELINLHIQNELGYGARLEWMFRL